MRTVLDRLQHRLVPALLAAAGVSLVAAGLLTYATPAEAIARASDPVTLEPSVGPVPSSLMTFPPLASPSASGSASPAIPAFTTRVVVRALGIDLPVIRQPGGGNAFPPCNVAMYLQQLHQPGQPGPTYLYAHARTGMFLPILETSKINNGRRMLHMLIQVYTADDQLYLYDIVEVRRHVTTLDGALAEKRETLWLQTSEGPVGTTEKTQVIALPLSHGPSDHKEAHPKAHPVFCH
jgi:sortase family protein